jgi:hypothetical protein
MISSILFAIFGTLKILNKRVYFKNDKLNEESKIGITTIISNKSAPPLR